MTLELSQTGHRNLETVLNQLRTAKKYILTSGLDAEMEEEIFESIYEIQKKVSILLKDVKVVETGRGRPKENGGDPRTPEEIDEDEAIANLTKGLK